MKITTLLIASLLAATLHAQDKPADPYRSDTAVPAKTPTDPLKEAEAKLLAEAKLAAEAEAKLAAEATEPEQEISMITVRFEAFSLPLAMAADLQRQNYSDSMLYTRLVSELGKESVRQEILQVIRGRSGYKSTSENISEVIYPTGYAPVNSGTQIPATSKAEPKDTVNGDLVYPNSWETRNIGTMLEIEPNLSEDDNTVDLLISPQLVTLAGHSNWGTPKTPELKMPEIEKQSLETAVTVRAGFPCMLGTFSRPPISKLDPDSANRVWFAFVTATVSRL